MTKPAFFLTTSSATFDNEFEGLIYCKRESEQDVRADVAAIVADVLSGGMDALITLTDKFDRWRPTSDSLRVERTEIDAAVKDCPPQLLKALKRAAERIKTFHDRQFQTLKPDCYVDEDGVTLGSRWTSIDAVGLYVPGGLAAYPSSVLMNAIPAQVAGVRRVVMAVPAPNGQVNPLVLVAAKVAGITDVWRIGGAQAIAALAFGCGDDFKPVDKIVGPGNAWVAEAKRQVFGHVGIDMIAGPSEVCVVADAATPAEWTAMDLLAQAEHDCSAQSILITDDFNYGQSVCAAVAKHLKTLSRAEIAGASWEKFGAVVICRDMSEVPAIVDRLAPEHLQLSVNAPEDMMKTIRHAGAVFLGRHTPEAVGDYIAGPNHVLPTSRSARFSSGLSVLDFMKRTTFAGVTAQALSALSFDIAALAEAEGLEAHGKSVTLRSHDSSQ